MSQSEPMHTAALRLLAILLAWLSSACTALGGDGTARPFQLSEESREVHQGVRLLGTLALDPVTVDRLPLVELSGLAWDADEGLLYALSDHGNVFHLRPVFGRGRLVDLHVLSAHALTNANGRPYRGKAADSEGLALRNAANGEPGDTELVVSFERRPRILGCRPDGRCTHAYPLPPRLADRTAYRSPNKALEAVAWRPGRGYLTGAEWPLEGDATDAYLLFDAQGPRYRLPRHPAPRSALVAMEALPDGSLLTLERSYVSVWRPLRTILRRAKLPAEPKEGEGTPIPLDDVRQVAVFASTDGWLLDNFEGLAHHRDGRFFMVSDDNQSPLQQTLLVYFEVLEP
jgi:hypothetical protein